MQSIPLLDTFVLKIVRRGSFDTLTDMLNFVFTPIILSLIALATKANDLFGKPFGCYVPLHIIQWKETMEAACLWKETYVIENPDYIPLHRDGLPMTIIGYYAWMPLMFFAQVLMFHGPIWVLRNFVKKSGLDIEVLIERANKIGELMDQNRMVDKEKAISNLGNILEEHLSFGRTLRTCCFKYNNDVGMSTRYLLMKAFYILVIIGQFPFLSAILGSNFLDWGIDGLLDLCHGRRLFESSDLFPLNTVCDVKVLGEDMVGAKNHTIGCVLANNKYYELASFIIWIWLVVLGVVNVVNILYLMLTNQREEKVRQWLQPLRSARMQSVRDDEDVKDFYRNGLGRDGVLVLQCIADKTDILIVKKLTDKLFKDYQRIRRRQNDKIDCVV